MRKYFGVILFAAVISLLSGCDDKGSKFVGSWECLTCVGKAYTVKQTMDIKKDGDIYHLDIHKYQNTRNNSQDINDAKDKLIKLEAKAESDSVLSLIKSPAILSNSSTLRIENDKIFFGNDEYSPIK
ncbi:hypothetical protein ABNR98_004432 [Salmonella enterica]